MRFSPDGRWVVAGGEDGSVKIWDLTAGKLLHDFQQRSAAVVAMDFHPHEFLLASGGADGVVTFWDLETFELIANAGPSSESASQNLPVGSITFAPNGQSLLASYRNSLCVWGWEPGPIRLDSIGSEWVDVMDMTIVSDQLIACTGQEDQVGTWMVSLAKLNLGSLGADHKHKSNHMALDSNRRQDFKVNSVRNVIKASDGNFVAHHYQQTISSNIAHLSDEEAPEPPKDSKLKKTPIPTPIHIATQAPTPTSSTSTPTSATPVLATPKSATPTSAKTPKRTKNSPHQQHSFGIDMTPFLQKPPTSQPDSSPEGQEAQLINHVADHHDNLMTVLGTRMTHFKQTKIIWVENGSGGDSKGILAVVGTLGELEDTAVTVEVLRMLPHREDYLTLDLCTALLPLMIDLFNFTCEDYLLQALAWTSRLVKAFGHVIKTTREAPLLVKGVDITKEERLEKCQLCHGNLITIHHLVAPLSRRSGSVGSNAKDLAALLKIYVPDA